MELMIQNNGTTHDVNECELGVRFYNFIDIILFCANNDDYTIIQFRKDIF